jgi:peptidyl-prolyl isomerase D
VVLPHRRFSLLANLSLAGLKTTPPQPNLTITQTTRILSTSPSKHPLTSADKLKALFRRGQAYVLIKDDEAAEKDFKAALELGGDGAKAVVGELNKLKARKQALVDKQKKAYGKMFG